MKIKIITAYAGECVYREQVTANLKEYCERWGYEFACKFDGWEPSDRYGYWRKQEFMLQEFHDCDWLVWFDADCMILNMTTPLTDVLDDTRDVIVTGPSLTCESCGLPAYSAGIVLFRSCEWSRKFLQKWWDSYDWYNPCTGDYPDGGCYNDNSWLTCEAIPKYADHFKFIPRDVMGHVHTFGVPEQIAVHFYGSPEHSKLELFHFNEPNITR